MKMGLLKREWVGLAVLCSLFISCISCAIFSRITLPRLCSSQNFRYNQAFIEINVSGEVISPGVYKFPPGVSLKDILEVAELTPNADKKELVIHTKFFISANVSIPAKQIKNKKEKTTSVSVLR